MQDVFCCKNQNKSHDFGFKKEMKLANLFKRGKDKPEAFAHEKTAAEKSIPPSFKTKYADCINIKQK